MNTMGQILRNWRITLAVLFAAILIAGSFFLARGVEFPSTAQASTESALLKAIATKDSDGDGLPDWEESLYGTDPHVTDSFHLGMTDGEAVARGLIVPKAIADIPAATSTPIAYDQYGLPPPPANGTLTAAFAKMFFSLYISAKQAKGGAAFTESDLQNIASQAISSLSAMVAAAPDYKSANDITIAGSGADALRTFAANAEAVMMKNTANATGTPIDYLGSALQNDNTSAFGHLSSISKMYRDSAVGIAALSVPQELASADLMLINALARMSQIADDFSHEDTDPLAAILALQQYLNVAQALSAAFTSIGDVYRTAGVSIPTGTPGASFVNLIANVNARHPAAKNP